MSLIESVKKAFRTPESFVPPTPETAPKTWEASQEYELMHAIGFMKSPDFINLAQQFKNGQLKASTGYCNQLFLKEYFRNEPKLWDAFIQDVKNKKCLEIGPCVMSALSSWEFASERHIVEPLLEPIEKWQKQNLGFSVFEGLIGHSKGAEVLIESLVGKIDGAIFCRNCLDHSPSWPFILANISQYAAAGCKLLLWTDIDHGGLEDEGHYEITKDAASFRRLIESLGFEVQREYSDEMRVEKNWGCFAVKK